MNILFDTNVVLDVFLKRSPWNVQAEELIEHHIRNTITIHVSTLTLADMAYIGRTLLSPDRIKQNLHQCLQQFIVLPVANTTVQLALSYAGNDFEDSLQSAAAQEAQLDAIVTRDQTGFKSIPLKVLTPTELLQLLPSL